MVSTLELQWFEHLWNHENMLETGKIELVSINHSARSGGKYGILSIFFNLKVCCVLSFELLRRGDSNEYTQYTIFKIKKTITLNYPKYNNVCSYCIFLKDSRRSLKQQW